MRARGCNGTLFFCLALLGSTAKIPWVATAFFVSHGAQRVTSALQYDRNVDRETAPVVGITSPQKLDLNLVLIDHYDSYTFNLYDMLASICKTPPKVVASDSELDLLENVDGIVLSPGPGTPSHSQDMGNTLRVISTCAETPILGVCLGHQALGFVYGANVTLAPCGPVHGQVWDVTHDGSSMLFHNVDTSFSVVRYHSLVVDLPEDSDLQPIAWTQDANQRVLMGLVHKEYPHYGVQFHPESVGSQFGMQILTNFCNICEQQRQLLKQQIWKGNGPILTNGHARETNGHHFQPVLEPINGRSNDNALHDASGAIDTSVRYQVLMHTVESLATPQDVFEEMYINSTYAYWLDSSMESEQSRISIMGAHTGPLSHRIEYYGHEQDETKQGLYLCKNDSVVRKKGCILAYLQEALGSSIVNGVDTVVFENDSVSFQRLNNEEDLDIPFDFRGGYVGYLGYEVRHDAQRYLNEMEMSSPIDSTRTTTTNPISSVPTAAFLFADQSLVYDHVRNAWFMVGVTTADATKDAAVAWMKQTRLQLLHLGGHFSSRNQNTAKVRNVKSKPVAFVPNRSRAQYENDISKCHEHIVMGESYELCLTNQFQARVRKGDSPYKLYKLLRKRNPAPFAAFIDWNSQGATNAEASSAICCSSPERFVSVKRRAATKGQELSPRLDIIHNGQETAATAFEVEAKPIKGTCARSENKEDDMHAAAKLQASVKNRAENLMIVDLLRNDLHRVCRVGSVHVPKLMDIESYATVHQMVSTINGILDETKNAVDVLYACFPGGSMTGAPKLRSCQLLEDLEEGVSRGPYSGCLGYLSLNGSMDMNIVIRTATVTSDDGFFNVNIGVGGAITAMSESQDEYEEMLLKGRAVMEAVQLWANGDDDMSRKGTAELNIVDS